MAHLDDELAQALKDSEERSATEPTVAPVQAPHGDAGRKAPRGSLPLLIGLLAVGGGALALVLTNVDGSAIYSKGVDELLDQKAALKHRTVKVNGMLVRGSLRSNLGGRGKQPCEYRFVLQKNDRTLPVRFAECVVPDTFRDVPNMDVDVTATGTLEPGGYFQAESIMAKCPSKYEMKQRAAAGEAAPHGPGSGDGSGLPAFGAPPAKGKDLKNSAPGVPASRKQG